MELCVGGAMTWGVDGTWPRIELVLIIALNTVTFVAPWVLLFVARKMKAAR